MAEKVAFRLPKPYLKQWSAILQIAQRLLEHSEPLGNENLWPILGLCKKAAATTQGIAALASLELWGDALILGRTLIDVEVTIKWLLKEDTEKRIQTYLSGIDQEKNRLLRKMAAGHSVSAQILSDLIDPTVLRTKSPIGEIGRSWSGLTLRDMSREVDMERIYDIPYWVSSAFVHSHVLSVLDWNSELKKKEKVLAPMFSRDLDDLPRWLVLGGLPSGSLNIFMVVDRTLDLGLGKEIESIWTIIQECLSEVSGGLWKFSQNIKKGDVVIRGEHSGKPYEKVYSPRRVSNNNVRQRRKGK